MSLLFTVEMFDRFTIPSVSACRIIFLGILAVCLYLFAYHTYELRTIVSFSKLDPHAHLRTVPFFKVKHLYQCSRLFKFDFEGIPGANSSQALKRTLRNEANSLRLFSNCTQLFETSFYPLKPLSEEERDFPLAFVILINEHLEQIEMLLNTIYAPQNVYCFHIDLKAPFFVHRAMERLSSCFSNVVVAKERIAVSRSSVNMIYAQRTCMQELYYGKSEVEWKYALPLQGHDYPLRTNRELVRILKIHNGANDVELIPPLWNRFLSHWDAILDPFGFEAWKEESKHKKDSPPYGLAMYKGSFAVAVNRETVRVSLESPIVSDFLKWLNDTDMPDESFWSTINHNHEILNVYGGYPGLCLWKGKKGKKWISRFSIWSTDAVPCRGRWRNWVCLFSSGDLETLAKRYELFCNKFWIDYDPVAIDCMHELLYNRTYGLDIGNVTQYYFDESNYHNLSSVIYHKWKIENPSLPFNESQCPN